VDEHVVQLGYIRCIFLIAKTSEAERVEIDFERSVGCDQNVDTEIELFSSYQQGIFNITRDNIGFFQRQGLEGQLGRGSPFLELIELIDEENTFSLSLR
jgi:hypothetical protein